MPVSLRVARGGVGPGTQMTSSHRAYVNTSCQQPTFTRLSKRLPSTHRALCNPAIHVRHPSARPLFKPPFLVPDIDTSVVQFAPDQCNRRVRIVPCLVNDKGQLPRTVALPPPSTAHLLVSPFPLRRHFTELSQVHGSSDGSTTAG